MNVFKSRTKEHGQIDQGNPILVEESGETILRIPSRKT